MFTIQGKTFSCFLIKLYNLQKHENTKLRAKNAKCVLALSHSKPQKSKYIYKKKKLIAAVNNAQYF
jgi:hypothetical protein